MKKVLLAGICVLLLLSMVGCKSNRHYDKIINDAIDQVMKAWEEEYKRSPVETNGHVQIKNTRLLVLKENDDDEYRKYLEDVAFIVEFVIFTDYYGTAPYYMDSGRNNCVLVHKDGTMKVTKDPMKHILAATSSNLMTYIDEVIDYSDKYNVTKTCKSLNLGTKWKQRNE